MDIITILFFYAVLAMGGLLACLKIWDVVRLAIFNTDFDVYLIRSGRFVPEKDIGRRSHNKDTNKIRYWLVKTKAKTIDVSYDCIERVGKRDRITLIEKAPGQFTAVKREFITANLQEKIGSSEEMMGLLPMASKEEAEALFDTADKIASPGLFPTKKQHAQAQALAIVLVIFAIIGIGVTAFANMKYFEMYSQKSQEMMDNIIQSNCRAFARDEIQSIIYEANKTGKVPDWVFDAPQYRKVQTPDAGFVITSEVQKLVG